MCLNPCLRISLSRFGNLLYKNLNYFWAKYFGKIENGHLLMSIFQFTEESWNFDFLETIKKISFWWLKKSFSLCEHKIFFY